MADSRLRTLERDYRANPWDRGVFEGWLRVRVGVAGDLFRVRVEESGLFDPAVPPYNAQGRREWVHRLSGIVMVEIPAGAFMMGSPEGQGDSDERPQHRVEIKRPFLMAKYTVTQAEWERVMGNNPSHFQGRAGSPTNAAGQILDQWGHPHSRHPVESVSWDDCQDFCKKTNLRLPTEAMWEFACRAGTSTRYYTGDTEADLERAAWFGGQWHAGHRAVGLKEPNAFGLYDMLGNVFEWTQDRWHPNYQGAPENGFIAWDDDTGYNADVWTDGTLEDMSFHRVGCADSTLAPPEEDDAPEEEGPPRLIGYGLNVPVTRDPSGGSTVGLSGGLPRTSSSAGGSLRPAGTTSSREVQVSAPLRGPPGSSVPIESTQRLDANGEPVDMSVQLPGERPFAEAGASSPSPDRSGATSPSPASLTRSSATSDPGQSSLPPALATGTPSSAAGSSSTPSGPGSGPTRAGEESTSRTSRPSPVVPSGVDPEMLHDPVDDVSLRLESGIPQSLLDIDYASIELQLQATARENGEDLLESFTQGPAAPAASPASSGGGPVGSPSRSDRTGGAVAPQETATTADGSSGLDLLENAYPFWRAARGRAWTSLTTERERRPDVTACPDDPEDGLRPTWA